ncbi:14835_t:CDS:2, partial [Racocetra persica]
LKKDNEVVPERSAEHEPPLTNDTKERVSGAEAKPLLTTTPIIA